MESETSLAPVPSWDRDYPGRYEAELAALRDAGTRVRIDQDRLALGTLELEVDWVIDGRIMRLKVAYPQAFPWVRPTVCIDAPAAELPSRHCSPIDGQLCLLGRDTRQWNTNWTLQHLLDQQLVAAVNDAGEQDPQAEPVEVWWNTLAADETGYCLVDSSWNPTHVGNGTITILFDYRHGRVPELRGCAVAASAPGYSASFAPPVAGLRKTTEIPWAHLDRAPVPDRVGSGLARLIDGLPKKRQPIVFDHSRTGGMFAFSYPMEVSHGVTGTGWLFAFATVERFASRKGGGNSKHRNDAKLQILQTLRAGIEDLHARDPGAATLAGKRVVVVGAGAIGAPIAIGLAKNGVTALDLIDHDRVEPGNSIRWVVGPPAWGLGKSAALKAIIEEYNPSCRVVAHQLMVGAPDCDITSILEGADLIVDATAAYGPGMWLGAKCKNLGVPLLAAMAWANGAVGGGLVALHAPRGGCPHCLAFAQHQGEAPPFGDPGAEPALQPPGCGERTFVGSGHDLQEVSLQALRMVPAALGEPAVSVIATLRFETSSLGMRLPRWDMRDLRAFRECGCMPYLG